jgi:hypothetical protein
MISACSARNQGTTSKTDAMSGVRNSIVVSAFVLGLSALGDADELQQTRAQSIDLLPAATPAVEIHHGPRVRVPSFGGKTTADIPIWRTATLDTYTTIDALRPHCMPSASISKTWWTRHSVARCSTSAR